MGRPKKSKETSGLDRPFVPASTPEAREQQLISLAVDRAEEQLRDGTASAAVITHYLKLGTSNSRLEKEKLEQEVELLKAKTKAYESAEDLKELYSNALNAMRDYGGHMDSNDED